MRTLALDGRTGASGDMLLGALIAVGGDPGVLVPIETALEVTYHRESVSERGVTATDVTVVRSDGSTIEHIEENGHHVHRDYEEVRAILGSMDIPERARATAAAIFERLGRAEAAVHGTSLEETTFHEVGADDAIADVVGVATLLTDLDVDQIVTTPVALGGGEVTFTHGTYPVPVPAVIEILEDADFEVRGGPVDVELLTPTGAAILSEIADGVDAMPEMRIDASGYGAGTRDLGDRPNVLRATIGRTRGHLRREPITVLETNVDDVSPEIIGDLHDRLAEAGALDVSVVPLGMKKSRPGHLIRVITDPADADRVTRALVRETGTLGVRASGTTHRWIADRHQRTVALTIDGDPREIAVKVATDTEGTVLDVSAEHDDARAVADRTDRSVREIIAKAEAAARDALEE